MSAPVAATSTWTLDVYTIKQQPMFDNRAFAIFMIFLRGKLIGRQVSYPAVSDCHWHEVRQGVYAHQHESHRHSGGYIIQRRGKKASMLSSDSE